MIIDTDDLPRVLDTRLLEGGTTQTTKNYKYNLLRGILHQKSNACWNCSKLGSCDIEKIFKCNKVHFITKNLNIEDYSNES